MFSVSLFTIYTSFFLQSDDGKPALLDLYDGADELIQDRHWILAISGHTIHD